MNIILSSKDISNDNNLYLLKNLYEYNANEFSKVLSLYKKSKYQIPMIQSVIDGKLDGRILSDKKINPKTIVIITNFNWMYVIGNQESKIFIKQFSNFIINELTSKSEHFAWFGLSEYWRKKLTEMYGENAKSFPRVRYELNEEEYKKHSYYNTLPVGYRIELINSHLVDKASKFFDGIKMFWVTNENFLTNSFGFCMLHNDDVISACQALAITENICEIDVITEVNYRGQGLAYFICFKFIEQCLKLGLKPYWETVRVNTSSCRLAEKLGFVEVEEYPFYAWYKSN